MSDRNEKILQAAKLWAAAAWADDVITDEEKVGMAAIIKVSGLDDAQRDLALSWLDTKVELEDLAASELPAERRHGIYKAAAHIASVDREVVDAERVFLSRLRDALGIDEVTARELTADVPGLHD